MYLKKLELKGFKSFPTKTQILFEKGVTAVVGPNGSGKSNISDAIRWVLGEQSVKSLRGEKLEDVIFSGTDTKKEMNSCEVSLTLDNKEKELNIDSDELVIKRQVSRDGESHFYINNKSCRLKDVREILMDTGIGKDGYSIIEQGKVEDILSNNPANRRKIFDEACGIAKFRYKKNEAEKNLKKSRENLSRIDDIYIEIKNQLKPLEVQQEKAKAYLDYFEKLRVLEVNDIINKNTELEVEIGDITQKMKEVISEIKLLEEDRNRLDFELKNVDEEISSVENLIELLNEDVSKAKEEINNKNTEMKLTAEKIKNQEADIRRKRDEINISSKKIDIDKEELKKLDSIANEDSYLIEAIEGEISGVFEEKRRLESEIEKIDSEIEDNRLKSDELTKNKQLLSENIARVGADLANMVEKKLSLEKEVDTLSENLDSRIREIEEKKIEIERKRSEVGKITEKIHEKNKSISKVQEVLKKIEGDLKDKEYLRLNIETKKNSYMEMERHHEGYFKGTKSILNNKSLDGVLGALGELINVPKEYEKAIGSSLGSSIQNIVVEDEISAKKSIEYLKKNKLGVVTFLPLSVIRGKKIGVEKGRGVIAIASDLVDYEDRFKDVVENSLGKTIVVDNIDNAISYAKNTNHRYRIVTLDGEILNQGGSLTGGSQKTSSNILSRKREIDEMALDISSLSEDITNLNFSVKSKRLSLKEDKELLEGFKKEEASLKLELASDDTEVKLLKKTKDDKIYELDSKRKEISGLAEKIGVDDKNFENLKKELESLSQKSRVSIHDENKYTEKKNELSLGLNEVVKSFNEKNLELARIKQKFEGDIISIERAKESIDRNKDEMYRLELSIKDDETNLDILDELIDVYGKDIEKIEDSINEIEDRISDNKLKKEDLKIGYDEMNRELRTRQREFTEISEKKFKLEAKFGRANGTRENLVSRLYERYELSFDEALDFKSDIVVDYSIIESLKKSIKKLGNVNLNSIEEYEEVKSRFDFYSEQKNDLELSITSLNELIDDLTSSMKDEFSENFNLINENFKKVYVKLFGGGTSNLRIVDEEDILASEIEITAQPPGKKMKSLNLLSGGEKALTAICILFSILISKPTPFCILDEIEAPLDDVNVDRFGEYLRELSEDTQFITVTHRRGTMESADFLYGITMQEKGISSIFSINIKDAEKMIES